MSKLVLKSIELNNFMGCKHLKIDLDERSTFIYGDNGVGKSRLEEAFNWCLFGKNTAGREDFPIKNTKDLEMHKADHEVCLVFLKNGMEEKLKRILRQKHDKEGNYNGNDTICYWNDIQLKVTEYKMKVDSMIREQVFKMITNVNFFNDDKLTPKAKRREILVKLVGGYLSDEELAGTNKDYRDLLTRLADENKSIEDLDKQVKQQISRLNDDINKVQPAIDEITRNMPEDKDWSAIESEIKEKKSRIEVIDGILQDVNKATAASNKDKQEKQQELHRVKTKIADIKFDVESKVRAEIKESGSDKVNLQNTVAVKQQRLNNLKSGTDTTVKEKEQNLSSKRLMLEGRLHNIDTLKSKIQGLQDRWALENQKQMPEVDTVCPTCKQDLPSHDLASKKQDITANWNKHLLDIKSEIEAEGKRYSAELKQELELVNTIEASIVTLEQELADAKAKLATDISTAEKELAEANAALANYVEPEAVDADALILQRLSSNDEYLELNKKKNELEEDLNKADEQVIDQDHSEIKLEKQTLQSEIDELNKTLGLKSVIEQNKNRIQEHKDNAKLWASELVKYQGTKNTIQEFNRAKITSLEERINSKFQFTKFRMFKTLVNGELEDDCEAIYGDRPYSALNTADRINCGLDIINTLCSHFDIYAPIFIDNRESITKLIPAVSQTIQMFVSSEDKELRVV